MAADQHKSELKEVRDMCAARSASADGAGCNPKDSAIESLKEDVKELKTQVMDFLKGEAKGKGKCGDGKTVGFTKKEIKKLKRCGKDKCAASKAEMVA